MTSFTLSLSRLPCDGLQVGIFAEILKSVKHFAAARPDSLLRIHPISALEHSVALL